MLLHDARRAARLDADGDLVTLEDQDRGAWDAAEIAEGVAMLEAALRRGRTGPYQVQAAIAACHVTAARAADTDWAEIARLYEQLVQLLPTPVVELNRAVAVGMADGPEAGLRWSPRWSSRAGWPATTCCPRPRRTCTAGWAGRTRRRPATGKRSGWPAPMPNGATSAGAWPKLAPAKTSISASAQSSLARRPLLHEET